MIYKRDELELQTCSLLHAGLSRRYCLSSLGIRILTISFCISDLVLARFLPPFALRRHCGRNALFCQHFQMCITCTALKEILRLVSVA